MSAQTDANDLATARREAENWRDVALYFADVLAASAAMALDRKTTAKCERKRQESIVRMAYHNVCAGYLWEGRRSQMSWVKERLERILAEIDGKGTT
jgi:hypothetical protein